MRPPQLNPLFREIGALKGLGPRLKPLVERLTGPHVIDLLWHLPVGAVDRRHAPKVADAISGDIATLTVRVGAHANPPRGRRAPYRVTCHDDTGEITLVFFNGRADYLNKVLPEGELRVISGKVEDFDTSRQMVHPDHIVAPDEAETIRRLEPTYPLAAGVAGKTLGKLIVQALADLPSLPEWLEPTLAAKYQWPAFDVALQAIHHPTVMEDLSPNGPARSRLAYDEALATQLAMLLVRRVSRTHTGRQTIGDGSLISKATAALPYDLTGAQSRSVSEITADQQGSARMVRLLQGDVGSGKTVVAFFAALNAIEAGRQVALMAPTEILTRQHAQSLEHLAQVTGVRMAVLTGRDKGAARAEILHDLKTGRIDLLIGTHALFQSDVVFADLALAIVDEQHRFGVHQRLELAAKGRDADLLVMTATPIPRTLTLTLYGDMEVSQLDEKPPGRLPIDTRTVSLDRLPEVAERIAKAVHSGAKVYWVCPLVAESEVTDLAAAEDRHASLSNLLGNEKVALVHGQMKPEAKDSAMTAFASQEPGGPQVLVATTVIEVGVNVPEATIMVIEHAERFGLAQLHQLRGRVGRGADGSTCLLLFGSNLSPNARARLEVMKRSEDGFFIAEEDLRLRGAGDILGRKQSGLPAFHVLDLGEHQNLLELAKSDARLTVERDPELTSERGKALKFLLYLFEQDAAVQTLRAG